MIVFYVFLWESFIIKFLQLIKVWVKPATLSLIAGTFSALTRSRTDLIVENVLLRQQAKHSQANITNELLASSWMIYAQSLW